MSYEYNNVRMSASDKYIKEFQELYEKEYGKKLTWQESREAADELLGFFKLLLDIDHREQKLRLRLKTEPKGFLIENARYTCCICGGCGAEVQIWYDKNGFKCLLCQDALNKRLIPVSVCKDKDSWYQMWELNSRFGVKAPTVLKFVHQGKLKMRTVPDKNGKTHFALFLIKDNVGILPNKPRSRIAKTGENSYHTEYEKVLFPLLEENHKV